MGFSCGEGARPSRFLEPSSGSDLLKLGRPGGGPGGGGGAGRDAGGATPDRPADEGACTFLTSDPTSDVVFSSAAAADATAFSI